MTPCSGVRYSRKVELARRQWSGSAKGVIEGIGVVTCVYVNPTLDRLWVIDYRIYAPEDDGRTELEHVREMLKHTAHHKRLAFPHGAHGDVVRGDARLGVHRLAGQALLLPGQVEPPGQSQPRARLRAGRWPVVVR